MKVLCPSMMCADWTRLREEVASLEEAGADIFHCDIMDGTFVPNITLGTADIKAIRACTDRLIDAHLMIENPAEKVDWFLDAGADILYIHPESERYTMKTLQHIRARGAKAGIAVNPDTAVATIEELLPYCDYVMVMTVHPGFAGQTFIPTMERKIRRLADRKEIYGYQLMIDGACSEERVNEMYQWGADGFVLGTSALFGKEEPYQDIMKRMKGEAEDEDRDRE